MNQTANRPKIAPDVSQHGGNRFGVAHIDGPIDDFRPGRGNPGEIVAHLALRHELPELLAEEAWGRSAVGAGVQSRV